MSQETKQSQLVRYIAETLCDKPEQIQIDEQTDDRGIIIWLYVAQEDLGRMIGKGGATATSIRTLLRGLGSKNSDHYSFKIDKTPVA